MAFHSKSRSLRRTNSERSLPVSTTSNGSAASGGFARRTRWRGLNGCCRKSISPFHRMDRRLFVGRLLFCACLFVVATTVGTLSHRILKNKEQDFAQAQWEAYAERGFLLVEAALRAQRGATLTMASFASIMEPAVDKWPMVFLQDYQSLANDALLATQSTHTESIPELLFAPLVSPTQLPEWQNAAQVYYGNQPGNKSIQDPIVWSWNEPMDSTESPMAVPFDGTFTWASKYPDVAVPVAQSNRGVDSQSLFHNFHASESTGRAIDDMRDCVRSFSINKDPRELLPRDEIDRQCGRLLRLHTVPSISSSPISYLMQPIRPARDAAEVSVCFFQ